MLINTPSTDNPSLLWETLKAYSRGLIISYTKGKKRRQAEQRKVLESKLKHTEGDYLKKPSKGKLKEIYALCSALDCLLTKDAETKIRFARQIQDVNGKQFFDNTSINNIFRNFYEDLYKPQIQTNTADLLDVFFAPLNLPRVSGD